MGLILGIFLCLFTILMTGSFIYRDEAGKKRLKQLSDPIRQISEQEELFLSPYLQKYNLSYFAQDNGIEGQVYSLDGEGFDIHTYTDKGGSLVKMRLGDIEVYFPYGLDRYIDNHSNHIEIVVVEGVSINTLVVRVGAVLNINGHDLISQAQDYWQPLSLPPTEILSERLETTLEYDFRQSSIVYAHTAAYLILAILLLIFASWTSGIFYYIFIIAAIFAIVLMTRKASDTYNKVKEPQTVLRVKGHLSALPFKRLDHCYEISLGLCLGPEYYLHIPSYVTESEPNFIEDHQDIPDYQADITAYKLSGYTLLNAPDIPPLQKTFEHGKPFPNIRFFLYFAIIFGALAFFGMTDAFSAASQSYKQAIPIYLCLLLTVVVMVLTIASYMYSSPSRKKLSNTNIECE